MWLISALSRCIPVLQAQAQQRAMTAARLAFVKADTYEREFNRLGRLAQPRQEIEYATPANDDVRDWFIANGIPIA